MFEAPFQALHGPLRPSSRSVRSALSLQLRTAGNPFRMRKIWGRGIERSRRRLTPAEGHRLAMFSTILIECCASNPESIVYARARSGPEGEEHIDQEQAGVRPPRNQAAMLGLRGQILRSRPQAAGLFALRRARGAEARRRASGSAGGGRARPPRRSEPRRRRRAADRPRMVARAGARDRPGRPLAQAGRAAGVPPVRLCRRRQDDARPPHRRGRARARRPSPPSPARRRW